VLEPILFSISGENGEKMFNIGQIIVRRNHACCIILMNAQLVRLKTKCNKQVIMWLSVNR